MTRTKKKLVRVYRSAGSRVEVGPPSVWSKGEVVEIPARAPAFGDKGYDAFEARVEQVDSDGIAIAYRLRQGNESEESS